MKTATGSVRWPFQLTALNVWCGEGDLSSPLELKTRMLLIQHSRYEPEKLQKAVIRLVWVQRWVHCSERSEVSRLPFFCSSKLNPLCEGPKVDRFKTDEESSRGSGVVVG
jgi:hypothetical protein